MQCIWERRVHNGAQCERQTWPSDSGCIENDWDDMSVRFAGMWSAKEKVIAHVCNVFRENES